MDIDYNQEVRQMKTIAALYTKRSKLREAAHIYKTVIGMQEKYLGVYSPEIALSCYQLAEVYSDLSQYNLARPLFERAVSIWEELENLKMMKSEETIYFMDALIALQAQSRTEGEADAATRSNDDKNKSRAAA